MRRLKSPGTPWLEALVSGQPDKSQMRDEVGARYFAVQRAQEMAYGIVGWVMSLRVPGDAEIVRAVPGLLLLNL